MHFAMKNGKICFSLPKFLAISPAIQKIASDCGRDAVVHLVNLEGPSTVLCTVASSCESADHCHKGGAPEPVRGGPSKPLFATKTFTIRNQITVRTAKITDRTFIILGEGQKGTPGRGQDRKCHDRASLSRPLVLSLRPLTSLTNFPLFCISEDIIGRDGRGGASDKMGLEGKGTDLS